MPHQITALSRADPGFDVRGGANGLENLKNGGGGGGGGGGIFLLNNTFILYKVNNSVKLYFYGALLKSKIRRYKERMYKHS